MTDYYIRYALSADHLADDLERGYSFRLYQFFSSEEAARQSDLVEFYGVDPETIARHNDGTFGFALPGLCGFGPFDSVEEAEEEARQTRGYNHMEWPVAGIFAGRYVEEADASDGQVFHADALVKVVNLDEE